MCQTLMEPQQILLCKHRVVACCHESTTTTTSDLDFPALVSPDLKKNLFEDANNSCPTTLDFWNGLPGWIELGTCCWGTPEICVVDVI